MKIVLKTSFFLFFILMRVNGISQQYLWTSSANDFFVNSETKVISTDEIQDNFLKYYQLYEYYYDLSGFSKQDFLIKFENSNSYKFINKTKWDNFLKSINQTKEPTITCLKYNDGKSPVIMILIYSKEKFDVISFSNNMENGYNKTFNSELESSKSRFILFYKTLIGDILDKSQLLKINKKEYEEHKIDSLVIEARINNPIINKISLLDDENKVFTEEPQIQPEFPGGQSSWLRYLERTLNKQLPLKNGAPIGKYTVIVSFIVKKDGSVNDIKAKNDPGYGTKDEAIRVISRGPKWKPAVQNGRIVIYRHQVQIEFDIF